MNNQEETDTQGRYNSVVLVVLEAEFFLWQQGLKPINQYVHPLSKPFHIGLMPHPYSYNYIFICEFP